MLVLPCPEGVKLGHLGLTPDESVDPPRTDENIRKADITARMSVVHLTTDLADRGSDSLLSARARRHRAYLRKLILSTNCTHHKKCLHSRLARGGKALRLKAFAVGITCMALFAGAATAQETKFYWGDTLLNTPYSPRRLSDAEPFGIDPKAMGRQATIHENAYSSPIWYTP